MDHNFDTLIVITKPDLIRIKSNFMRVVKWLPKGRLIFIGSPDVKEVLDEWTKGDESGLTSRVGFINENDVIPFDSVHIVMTAKMQPLLKRRDLPRGVTGWYYQQFLKMEYSRFGEGEYYMSWDGDTVPCKDVVMFNESGVPFLDLKHEYNELYFTTMGRLIPGLKKFIEASFISEHMLFKRDIMQQLIAKIESNNAIEGEKFYEKIINCIPLEDIQENGFSEFETYGNFVCLTAPYIYRLREWHSFRLAGEFFDPDTISDDDYDWLSRDFDAISFEKGMTVREDHKNLFDNKEYQSKLSARQMLMIAQEEFKDGYKEKL
ncbi:MAG: hypothetical protein K6F34_03020 [Lachnospiraceae bacterium]|nr:hypothetical protein [Lachnospiraceae bacterium]